MAKPVLVAFGGLTTSFVPRRVERSQLYGSRKRVAVDAQGRVCTKAALTADGATLVGHMLHDKKMAAGTLPFLLARGIGQTFLSKDVALDDVAAFLDQDRATAL